MRMRKAEQTKRPTKRPTKNWIEVKSDLLERPTVKITLFSPTPDPAQTSARHHTPAKSANPKRHRTQQNDQNRLPGIKAHLGDRGR